MVNIWLMIVNIWLMMMVNIWLMNLTSTIRNWDQSNADSPVAKHVEFTSKISGDRLTFRNGPVLTERLALGVDKAQLFQLPRLFGSLFLHFPAGNSRNHVISCQLKELEIPPKILPKYSDVV